MKVLFLILMIINVFFIFCNIWLIIFGDNPVFAFVSGIVAVLGFISSWFVYEDCE